MFFTSLFYLIFNNPEVHRLEAKWLAQRSLPNDFLFQIQIFYPKNTALETF